jgi:hypothetical protein
MQVVHPSLRASPPSTIESGGLPAGVLGGHSLHAAFLSVLTVTTACHGKQVIVAPPGAACWPEGTGRKGCA